MPIETTEIPESLGTIEGEFRNIEAMRTTSNQTLKRKDSEMFLTRSEEILSTDMCSRSMEAETNLMQNELNMLSMIPFSSANNVLNVNKFLTDIEAGDDIKFVSASIDRLHISVFVNPATGCYIEICEEIS